MFEFQLQRHWETWEYFDIPHIPSGMEFGKNDILLLSPSNYVLVTGLHFHIEAKFDFWYLTRGTSAPWEYTGYNYVVIIHVWDFFLRYLVLKICCGRIAGSTSQASFGRFGINVWTRVKNEPKNFQGGFHGTYIPGETIILSFAFIHGCASTMEHRGGFVHFVTECHTKLIVRRFSLCK